MEPATPNPYEAPATAARPSRLARLERDALKQYLMYREQQPTLLSLITGNVMHWLWFSMLTGPPFLIAALLLMDECVLGIWLGLLAGFALRDVGLARLFVILWPMLNDVLDWDRVQARYDQMSQ